MNTQTQSATSQVATQAYEEKRGDESQMYVRKPHVQVAGGDSGEKCPGRTGWWFP